MVECARNINGDDTMADKQAAKDLQDRYMEKYLENWPLNWRAWGSWFSWGSPVGLGLFFVETAVAIAILVFAFRG